MKQFFRSVLIFGGGYLALWVIFFQVVPRLSADKGDLRQHEDAMGKLKVAKEPRERAGALGEAALQSARLGKLEEAAQLAGELAASAPTDGDDLEKLHTALGLVALKQGDVAAAKEHLLASGRAPDSPVRGSFGPTMVLAKGLLKAGEKETVLQFFDLCRNFWGFHADKLDAWSRDVRWGIPPDFSYNLK